MKNTTLQLCNETIHPGERLSLALPLPELYSCAPLHMPIKIIHGRRPGPCLLVMAAMHGNELNGTEIINRLFNSSSLKHIQGTLIAIPVMNVYGLINRSRYLPGGIELDRSFPGSDSGTLASRLAHIFTNEIFSKADFCIDLQTGSLNHSNLPQVNVNFLDPKAKALAQIFGAPVISNLAPEEGTLQNIATERNVPYLTYEAGEAMRFDEHAIKVGLRGIQNVLRELGMLTQKHARAETRNKCFFTDKTLWLRSSCSGLSHTKLRLGQHVQASDALCTISDPFGTSDSVTIYSPEEAIIVAKNNLPLVNEGETLFQLATFSKMEHASSHLGTWKEQSKASFEQA